jgi:peroxiredoxin
MAQLRQDYQKFKDLNCEVVVIVPNGPKSIARYVQAPTKVGAAIPYPILCDKGAKVAREYQIKTRQVLITTFTPTVLLVDRTGCIRYSNYQTSYIQEPDNREALAVLEEM